MVNKFREFLFESNDFDVKLAVDSIDNDFVKKLIDKLSFLYKKRKERYLRPVKIVGVMNETIQLRIEMSNKDIVLFSFQDGSLKISINGSVVYYMDDVEKDDIIKKIEYNYKKYIKEQNFNVISNDNPFE
jgi:hypothetical protein